MKTNMFLMIAAAAATSLFVLSGPVHASSCGSDHGGTKTATKNASAEVSTAKNEKLDIVETAVAAGSFKTLVAAVQAAGLVETLQGEGPFTVFAPTDEAFAKLPEGTVESLLKPENKARLIAILTYHVVPGKVTSSDVVKVKTAKTVQGQELPVQVKNGAVQIGNATVAKADVMASNGVIHVIDTVLLPKL